METTELPLDGKSEVELNLPKEELFQLMLMAHERDLTLNQMVEYILRQEIERLNGNSPEA